MCYISYQTKEITSIEKFDGSKTQIINLIDTDNKLPENITQKNYVILMACAIKDDGKSYLQLFLEEALLELQSGSSVLQLKFRA